jgi:hypothetical protein
MESKSEMEMDRILRTGGPVTVMQTPIAFNPILTDFLLKTELL